MNENVSLKYKILIDNLYKTHNTKNNYSYFW